MDVFVPSADNANGIAEMVRRKCWGGQVQVSRQILANLDAVVTHEAVTKGWLARR